jgi:hypothetical protein
VQRNNAFPFVRTMLPEWVLIHKTERASRFRSPTNCLMLPGDLFSGQQSDHVSTPHVASRVAFH